MTIKTDSFQKSLEILHNEMENLQKQIKNLPPKEIIEKISFLELKHAEILSIQSTLQQKRAICSLSENSKEVEFLKKLEVQLENTNSIWNQCHSFCRDIQLNEMKQNIEKPGETITESNLANLKRHLKQLLLNPLLTLEQKEIIQNIQNKINKAFSEIDVMKQTPKKTECLPVHSVSATQKFNGEMLNLGTLGTLPIDVILLVLSNLSPKDLCVLAQTNKSFQKLCNDSKIWTTSLSHHTGLIKPANLREGLYTETLIGKHSNTICLCKDGNFLYSGALGGTIKVWDLTTNQCITILNNQNSNTTDNDAFSICIKENFLYAGLRNGSIKIWNLTTKECVGIFEGHKEQIESLIIKGDFLYSGSSNGISGTIKIWDLNTHNCLKTLTGVGSCNFLHVEGDFLYIAAGLNIGVYDLKSDKKDLRYNSSYAAILKGHEHHVKCLRIHQNHLYSSSWDGTIKVWDLSKKECIATLGNYKEKMKMIDTICIDENLLYSPGISCIRIWDLSTNKCVAKIKIPVSPDLMIIDKGFLYFSNGYYVKVYNLTTSWNNLMNAAEAILEKNDLNPFISFGEPLKDAVYKELQAIEQFPESIPNHLQLPPHIQPPRGDILITADGKSMFVENKILISNTVKNAFLREHGLTTTNENRAQAIYRFVLKEILSLFEKGGRKLNQALDIFKLLPSYIKNDIYGQLLEIMKMKKESFPEIEHAFLDPSNWKVTNNLRKEAIQVYLDNSKRSESTEKEATKKESTGNCIIS